MTQDTDTVLRLKGAIAEQTFTFKSDLKGENTLVSKILFKILFTNTKILFKYTIQKYYLKKTFKDNKT